MDKKLLSELQDYIHLHSLDLEINLNLYEAESVHYSPEKELQDYILENRKESFPNVLFELIDIKGFKDPDVYKKAGIDRRHFSKIRSNPNYKVSKQTAISLALALELTMEETETLLRSAGFTLSEHDTFDLIIRFFIEKEFYELDPVNEALHHFNLKPLINS